MRAVAFDVPSDVAFDYLVDPRNRPEWQSSLRRVELVDPRIPATGQTWVDVTSVGVRPAMETVRLDRPVAWTERGAWGPIEATLTLRFAPEAAGCHVAADVVVAGSWLLRPATALLTLVAPYAVRADLRRASRILSARRRGH